MANMIDIRSDGREGTGWELTIKGPLKGSTERGIEAGAETHSQTLGKAQGV